MNELSIRQAQGWKAEQSNHRQIEADRKEKEGDYPD